MTRSSTLPGAEQASPTSATIWSSPADQNRLIALHRQELTAMACSAAASSSAASGRSRPRATPRSRSSAPDNAKNRPIQPQGGKDRAVLSSTAWRDVSRRSGFAWHYRSGGERDSGAFE